MPKLSMPYQKEEKMTEKSWKIVDDLTAITILCSAAMCVAMIILAVVR